MKKILLIMFLLVTFANTGWCATVTQEYGGVGDAASAELDVNITIPKLIRISGIANDLVQLQALSISDITSSNGKSLNTTLCVSSNLHTGEAYKVRATDTGNGTNKFQIKNQESGHTSEALTYTVKFNDQGTPGGTALTYGQATENAFHYSENDGFRDSCSNANVQITFSQADLYAAKHGTYSGVLTIEVEPE